MTGSARSISPSIQPTRRSSMRRCGPPAARPGTSTRHRTARAAASSSPSTAARHGGSSPPAFRPRASGASASPWRPRTRVASTPSSTRKTVGSIVRTTPERTGASSPAKIASGDAAGTSAGSPSIPRTRTSSTSRTRRYINPRMRPKAGRRSKARREATIIISSGYIPTTRTG